MKGSEAPSWCGRRLGKNSLAFCEDDDERKQRQGFDEGETEKHSNLDRTGRAWIARHAFQSGRDGFALTETAKTGRDRHRNRGWKHKAGCRAGGGGSLNEERGGEQGGRQ